jgi:hypothetical protein
LTALESALDEMTCHDEPVALVLTGSGKFFSNCLDLEYMGANPSR